MINNKRYHKMNENSLIITDALGCKIDKGIRKLIVLLNYNYIITIQSCWGHTTHGLSYPWIDIENNCYDILYKTINGLNLEIIDYGDSLRLVPIDKSLKGRITFNELKKNL